MGGNFLSFNKLYANCFKKKDSFFIALQMNRGVLFLIMVLSICSLKVVAVDVEDTMDLRLIGSKMEATIMKPLPKVAAVGFLLFYLFLQSFNTSNSFPYGMWCVYLYVFTYNVGLVFSQHVAI